VEKEAEMSSSSSERGGVHHVRTRSSDSSTPSPTSSSKNSTIFSHSNNSKEQQQQQQQQQQQNNGETILIINKAGTNTNSRGQMRKSASMLQFSEHAINQVQGLSKRGLELPVTPRLQRRRYRYVYDLMVFFLFSHGKRYPFVDIMEGL
jgi:hypothetical protein